MIRQQIIEGFINKLHSMPVALNVRGGASRLEHILRRVKDQFRQAFSNDLAIALGTSNTIIYVPDQGVVLNEPSIIAFDDATNKVVAVGREAKLALGRQASTIRIVRPVKEGVIADFDAAEIMLSYFIKTAMAQRKLYNPRVLICAPSDISEVERRAFEDAAGRAGARHVEIIEESLTAAMGAGFDLQSGRVFMLVDIGGGKTDIAILGFGGPVHLSTLRVGGSKMDEAIIQHMRHSRCLEIGELTAEAIKMELGSYSPKDRGQMLEVRGRDLKTGLPALVTVESEEVKAAIDPIVEEIAQAVRNAIEDVSAEVSAALIESGIVLSGGVSQLAGLAERITRRTGIAARQAASDVQSLSVVGAGKLFREGTYVTVLELMAQHGAGRSHNDDSKREYPVKQVA